MTVSSRMPPVAVVLLAAVLLAACPSPAQSTLADRLEGSWRLESVCEAEVPEPGGCAAPTNRVVATFDPANGEATFSEGLPSGRYQLTTEQAPSGREVAYLTLAGNGPAAQLEVRADTLVISWQYVDGAAYRFLRE
jgi:hypothetical protein